MDIYLKELKDAASSFRFPSMPEEIRVKGAANYQSYDIINKGTFQFPSGVEVASVSWNGYFFGEGTQKLSLNREWKDPAECVKKLEAWRDAGTVLNLIVSGGNLNIDVTVSEFEYSQAGGRGTYEYSITLKKWRELKIYTTAELDIESFEKKTVPRETQTAPSNTYTVVSGDNLWKIARKFYGGSGADWQRIYDANKDLIESTARKYGKANSDMGWWIYPGTVLTIPA